MSGNGASGSRVCIICPASRVTAPYLSYYTEILRASGITFDVLEWDRREVAAVPDDKVFRTGPEEHGLANIANYLKFRSFVRSHLRRGGYEEVVVLTTQMGVLLARELRDRKYLLDIRDYSYERLRPYRVAARRAIERAGLTVISSGGFREWLPTGHEYVLAHNASLESVENPCRPGFNRDTRNILYIGLIGYAAESIEFLEAIIGWPGVSMRYVGPGEGSAIIGAHCKANGISAVSFRTGVFTRAERDPEYESANFVTAVYGDRTVNTKTLLPNKLYESCSYGRPIIVSAGTYLARAVEKHGLGIVFDRDDREGLLRDMDRYYDTSYYEEYLDNRDRFLREVAEDIRAFRSRVREFIEAA